MKTIQSSASRTPKNRSAQLIVLVVCGTIWAGGAIRSAVADEEFYLKRIPITSGTCEVQSRCQLVTDSLGPFSRQIPWWNRTVIAAFPQCPPGYECDVEVGRSRDESRTTLDSDVPGICETLAPAFGSTDFFINQTEPCLFVPGWTGRRR